MAIDMTFSCGLGPCCPILSSPACPVAQVTVRPLGLGPDCSTILLSVSSAVCAWIWCQPYKNLVSCPCSPVTLSSEPGRGQLWGRGLSVTSSLAPLEAPHQSCSGGGVVCFSCIWVAIPEAKLGV